MEKVRINIVLQSPLSKSLAKILFFINLALAGVIFIPKIYIGLPLYVPGIFILSNYYKMAYHKKVSKNKAIKYWKGSLIYNLVLFGLTISLIISKLDSSDEIGKSFFIVFASAMYQVIIALISLDAIKDNRTWNDNSDLPIHEESLNNTIDSN